MEIEEVLTVTFCSDNHTGETGLAVFKESKRDNRLFNIKVETGKQAYDLYYLLTNQAAKVEEIKVDKSESGIKLRSIKDTNISKSMWEQLKNLKNGGERK